MRRILVVGLVGGAAVATAVLIARRSSVIAIDGEPDWAPLTLLGPSPAVVAADAAPITGSATAADPLWVAPDENGDCPGSHPIKANKSSRIFHLPGGQSYARTRAERCYCDAAAAEADGYRAAKR